MIFSILRFLKRIRRHRKLGVAALLAVVLTVVVGNALTFYFFERDAQAGLRVVDSFWYSLVSITTIGYGDYAATTTGGRVGAVIFVMVIGLAAFTAFVGLMVDSIMEFQLKERSGMSNARARDHLLVVNFPNEVRVRQIVEEFSADSGHKNRDVVILTDAIEALPFSLPNVHFVRGSPLEEETYQRANVTDARLAIVLSTGFDDPNSDSVAASVTSIIEHLNPTVKIVVECLNRQHSLLFSKSERVSLVYTLRVAYNMLVQEAQDPGVYEMARAITTNEFEGSLVSTKVENDELESTHYISVAKSLLDDNVNLLGVIRDGDVVVDLKDVRPRRNDLLVYIGGSRLSWGELSALIS